MSNSENNPIDQLRSVAQDVTVEPGVARRRGRLAQVVIASALLVFTSLAIASHYDPYFSWDVRVENAVQAINWPGFGMLMTIISMPGNNLFMATSLVITAIVVLYLINYRAEALTVLVSAGTGQLIDAIVKLIVGRPRPTADLVRILAHEHSLSFPSGHTMHYTVFYGCLWFLAYTHLRHSWVRFITLTIWGGLVMLVGLSRVYLGAHWPSDVTGGYIAGGIWLTLVLSRYNSWLAKHQPGKQ